MDRVSGLTIGEVAHRSGVAPSAIRYYESLGLIPTPPRLHGERRYAEEVFGSLAFIAVAQAAGFTLREIQALGAHAETGTGLAETMQLMAEQKLAEVESTLARAAAMKEWLEVARSCGCSDPSECNLFSQQRRPGDHGSCGSAPDRRGRRRLPPLARGDPGAAVSEAPSRRAGGCQAHRRSGRSPRNAVRAGGRMVPRSVRQAYDEAHAS